MNLRTQTSSAFVIFGISLICFMPSVTLIKTADADADSKRLMEVSPKSSQPDLIPFKVNNMKSKFSQIGNDKNSLIRDGESSDNLHVGSEDISGKMIQKTKITRKSSPFQGQIESIRGKPVTWKPPKKFTRSHAKSRQLEGGRRRHRSRHANRKTASCKTTVTQGVPIRHTPSPPVPLEGISLYGANSEPDTSCPNCWIEDRNEEEVRSRRTAQFKSTMLEKLRITEDELSMESMHGAKLPREIRYKILQDNARHDSMEEFYAQEQEIIFQGQDLGRKCIKSRQVTGCYVFEFEGKVRPEVASAQLWLYKTPDRHDFSGQTVRVFELEASRRGRLRRRNLMVRQDTFVQEGWVTLNVTRSVRRWSNKNLRSAMVAIRCDTCRTRNHRALYGAKDGYRPLLVVDYDTSYEHWRMKRSESCKPSEECCRRPLEVNFVELEWSGVAHPESIGIGYCFGYCKDNHNSYKYNHTAWKQNVRLKDPNINDTIRQQLVPCCSPLAFQDISLLVYTGNASNPTRVRATVPNVIVASCGCV